MMSKHPLDLQPGRKLSKEEVAEALRLSITAELDAINLYLQLARAIDDERVRKVFEDIAKEEKTHVGEFLTLLKALDSEQVEELRKGVEEVKELTGIAVDDPGVGVASQDGGSEEGVLKQVVSSFKEALDRSRILRKHLPLVRLGRDAEAAVVERLVDGRLERLVEPLHEISLSFKVSQKSIEASIKSKQPIEMAEAFNAARTLAALEDKHIVEKLLKAEGTVSLSLGNWKELGTPVRDVANAVTKLYENGIGKPFILMVNPTLYSDLLIVHEKTGVTELERVKGLVDEVVVVPALPDNQVVVLSPQSNVLDIVLGGDGEVDYIGPEDGFHVFRAWETVCVRIKYGKGICVLRGS